MIASELILCCTQAAFGDIVEPRYNEGLRDWQNLFAITGFVISRLFSLNITITGEKKIVRYTKDFVI